MRISQNCAECLYERQKKKTDNAEFLAEIRSLLDNRKENDTSPYMLFSSKRLISASYVK